MCSRRLGPVRIVDREVGTVEIEMPNPEVGLSPVLEKLLRVAARNDLAASPSSRHSQPRPSRRARADKSIDDAKMDGCQTTRKDEEASTMTEDRAG